MTTYQNAKTQKNLLIVVFLISINRQNRLKPLPLQDRGHLAKNMKKQLTNDRYIVAPSVFSASSVHSVIQTVQTIQPKKEQNKKSKNRVTFLVLTGFITSL